MQPEPHHTQHTAITFQNNSSPTSNTIQHGSNENEGVSLLSAVSDSLTVDSKSLAAAGSERARRLKATDTAIPLKSRIEEYESAASPLKAPDTTVFKVIPTSRTADKHGSQFASVPNELLTHVLSHLAPHDLAAMALVSRRLHDLVTTPHAWRSAFARYFPGPEAIDSDIKRDDESQAVLRLERRAFTRLTAKASWRSEYVLRTRLLRSLGRGRPAQPNTTGTQARSRVISPEITYSSELLGSINKLHATWSSGPNKRAVKFIHGADDLGTASISEPSTGKVERWGFADPHLFLQFTDMFPGDAQYGLAPGEITGAPNVMHLSQLYGMIYGQGFPGGLVFFRSTEEMRGRFLLASATESAPQLGIPGIASTEQSITSVWIAESSTIPTLTDGLIGMMSGSSSGVLTAYSIGTLGASNNRTARFERGVMTARWVLSPGVPLIAIAVDNDYSLKRQAENRVWAVVLNALGEVYYLTKFPRRAKVERVDEEHHAWLTGRNVYWSLAEASRRIARPDPYNESSVDGSYSPRSSWTGMCLSSAQIEAETREIEVFAKKKPKDIQALCSGWDMRRKLEVDFAGDDEYNVGETVLVFECGLEEGIPAAITRYTRLKVNDKSTPTLSTPSMTVASTPPSTSPSIFGGQRPLSLAQPTPFSIDAEEYSGPSTPRPLIEEWRTSTLSFGGLKKVRIATTTIDMSTHAVHTRSEDPLLNFADVSATSSPSLGPWSSDTTAVDVPGQRARLVAAGTNIGSILIWNIRASISKSSDLVNTIDPIRIIFTDSPQISSLALTSLYLVHGGSDGLVQAWDPLASELSPIRTLHSRFSSRARRQLVQAQASPQGIGTNMYAAGAICLDPDPTVLRGIVSLGNRLRYWSYSSSAADQYKSAKRRARRSERGSNQVGDRFVGVARTNLKDYIAGERFELEREKQQRRRDADHLAGRFGTELLDGSEEEMIAYAAMLSQETLAQEANRRSSDTSTAFSSNASISMWSSDNTATPAGSPGSHTNFSKTEHEIDADIAEAIRQSLSSSDLPVYDIPIRPAKAKARKGSSAKPSPGPSPMLSGAAESDDLEFALQLSLAEEASRIETTQGKGKQRQI